MVSGTAIRVVEFSNGGKKLERFSIGLYVTYIWTFRAISRARKEIEDHETPDLPEVIKPIIRPTIFQPLKD